MAKPGLLGSLKFRKLCIMLSLPEPWVLGHLERMWLTCHMSDKDGFQSAEDTEIAAGWVGDKLPERDGVPTEQFKRGEFVAACVEVGFLDKADGESLQVHNYLRHAPNHVKDKARKRQERRPELSQFVQDESGKSRKVQDCPGKSPPSVSLPSDPLRSDPSKDQDQEKILVNSEAEIDPSVSEILDSWTKMATENELPTPRKPKNGSSRLKTLKVRAKDKEWLKEYQEALERIQRCPFLLGNSDGGWKADIDWFLRPDSVGKILEGKYDGTVKPDVVDLSETGITDGDYF